MQTAIPEIASLLARLETEAASLLTHCAEPPLLIGIRTGGLWLAEHLRNKLALSEPISEIDVGFHRDDFATRGIGERAIAPTRINGTVNDRDILLIDDVLHTGRTIRAALNAIFEYGRPRRVWLAVLVARSGRQLPICPDIAGAQVDLAQNLRLRLAGPQPLVLSVTEISP